MKDSNKSNILKNLALVSQIGISMIVPILGGIFLGNFLDKKFGTGVIFLIILSIIGIMASFLNLFKMTTKDINKRK
ncbi:AtpZ/AtpI family protein [Sporosalibacterium faouarense]|uniref:AtpZ/AtpI family protein n=1 Tax=Sporosalibacterium faouarense TaxID=516123 RepID=UPI00141C9DD3|nr:AtpZ/AtpI family protein [Sporosalibacterium faouarense]MTI46870.1 AtpZ/AtpI family protein [Bacillota bacterium]